MELRSDGGSLESLADVVWKRRNMKTMRRFRSTVGGFWVLLALFAVLTMG